MSNALPNATFGRRLISFTSWYHYGLGVTLDQLIDIVHFHLRVKLWADALIAAQQRLVDTLTPWYEHIAAEGKASAYLHADETGWRVQGQTCRLQCCANGQVCYDLLDCCRGSPVVQKFFGDAFGGMLLHDFWTAYRSTDVARQQYYLVHLLREVEEVDEHHAARSSTTSRTPDDRPTPGGPPSPSGCYA